MYPYTLINLKESKKNNIKDFLSLVDIYGLSHMMMFTNTEKNSYMHFAKMPKGPTVTFVIKRYSLASDIYSNKEKDQIPLTKNYGNIPLLIMSGFNNSKIPEEFSAPIKIVSMMFQSFFPPVNLSEVQIKKFKRVVLVNLLLNEENDNIAKLKKIQADTIILSSPSNFTLANTIYSNIFTKTADIPCPTVNNTIISNGKSPLYAKNPPEVKAFINPINIIRIIVTILFGNLFIPNLEVQSGKTIKKIIVPTIPAINSCLKGNIFFFQINMNWNEMFKI